MTPEQEAAYLERRRLHAMGETHKVLIEAVQPGDIVWSTLDPTYMRVARIHRQLDGRYILVAPTGRWITGGMEGDRVIRLTGAGTAYLEGTWKIKAS